MRDLDSQDETGDDFHVANAPIVEAVVDIDCDLPIGIDFEKMETRVRGAFAAEYPKFRRQMVQRHQFTASTESPSQLTVQNRVQAYQCLKEDERQLVQLRTNGFSFNRLAPYESFDKYLPEIEVGWRRFRDLMSPVQVRRIALRYINRILLPMSDGLVELNEYLRLVPQLPDGQTLEMVAFFSQYSAVEVKTGHQVNISMLPEQVENERLPIIFDIEAMHEAPLEPEAWENIRGTLLLLRRLKNEVFRTTLTEQCLNLFR